MTSIIQNIKDGFKKRFGGLSKNKDQPILTKNDIIEWR